MSQKLHYIDPAQLAKVVDLQLMARTVVEGLLTGIHRSPMTGSAIEFAQYRPYTQGDDPRFIDWHLYGRTDRLRIKQYQEETNLRCTLLLDCSASMDYGSGPITKFDYARMLTACLAMILQNQRDQAGFIAYHHEILNYLPARMGPKHVRRILSELESLEPSGHTDTAQALAYLGDVLPARGMVVIISDLLHPLDQMIEHLKSVRARRHDVILVQISDPAERDFPFDKSQTFIDIETETEQFAVPENVRELYLENRRNHFEQIRAVCLASEIDMVELFINEPLDRGLHFFLHQRKHSLMTSSKTTRAGAGGGR